MLEKEEYEFNTNQKPLSMSAELEGPTAKIVVLGTLSNDQDTHLTLGQALDFLSKLKGSLTPQPEAEWRISFAADQTFKFVSYSVPITGQPSDTSKDTPTGVEKGE